jgi:hypothetical protein
MSLESKSQELKDLVSTFDTQWFLGDLSNLIQNIGTGMANDELGKLSSPLRQLYFIAGLLVSSDPVDGGDIQYSPQKWGKIVDLLNQIESEYDQLFFPEPDEIIDEQWKKVRSVAMPSFLTYFNQGPLNYEEQPINWIRELYIQLDNIIESVLGLKTEDFLCFYENLDSLIQKNFQNFSANKATPRPNWEKYTKIQMGVVDGVPDFIKDFGEKRRVLYTFMADKGIVDRFYPNELVSTSLQLEKVNAILTLLTTSRHQSDFLYYTATKPGNPLYEKPIVDIGDGLFQVFEIKQVIHSIESLLETICSKTNDNRTRLIEKKGELLEKRIVELFKSFFKKDFEVFSAYYVDGYEQDILFLWKDHAFIIEAKGYNLREPLRDPNKAFVRIKDDFKACIGYGYSQTRRVEQKFIDQVPLRITDKKGNLIKEIDTTKYIDTDFSLIVNLKSFGQIQNDLSTLLDIQEDSYPWVVKFDDLEVFILTLMAKQKSPHFFVDFLLLREQLHGKLICSDELQVCGAFISNKITEVLIEKKDVVMLSPDMANLFDEQYNKGMGFKNEKYLYEKKSGKYIFI